MFEFYRPKYQFNPTYSFPPEWAYIKRGMIKNLERVYNYYSTYTPSVKSEHFLVRLLQSISVPKSLSLNRYYSNVDALALNVSMTLGMTSSISKGSLFKGVLYGGNNTEILLADNSPIDPIYVHDNWKRVSPVTMLLTAKSDLGLHLANGEEYSRESGLSVFLINVPMLMIQYRAFLYQEAQKGSSDTKTTAQFVGGYVLPNLLYSQLDYCILNRAFNRYYKIDNGYNVPFRSHSFNLNNYDSYIDKAIDKMLANIRSTDARFENVLSCFSAINTDTAMQLLTMPDIAPTRQVDWLLTLARLKYTSFLFDLCGDYLIPRNNTNVYKMIRSFKTNNVYDVIYTRLNNDDYSTQEVYINNILSKRTE